MNEFDFKYIEDFNSKISDLSFSFVREIAKDHPQVNNVLRGLNKDCFLLLKESETTEELLFVYIIYSIDSPGILIRLRFREDLFYYYLLGFSLEITKLNSKLEAISIYNTFINAFRSYLESRQIITFLSSEFNKLRKGTLISHEDIEIIKHFDRVKFYRAYLGDENYLNFDEGKDYVYLIINEDDFTFKIGQSTRPKYREGTLQSKKPSVFLLKAWQCDKRIEKELHSIYSNKRVRGEWFKLDFGEISEINNVIVNLINEFNHKL